MSRLQVRGPEDKALVRVLSFHSNGVVKDIMQAELDARAPGQRQMYGERFWVFDEPGAACSVGRLIMGQVQEHPQEFADIGQISGSAILTGSDTQAGALALSASILRDPGLAEPIVTALIEATNEDILAIGSPYSLPLSVEG